MEYRLLGRTGLEVSPLCLGAMMFGAWGNTDHDGVDPDHPRGARRRDQLRRHRRRLLAGRVGGDRRQGARRPPRRGRARDEVPRPDGRGPEPERQLAALDRPGGRGEPAAAQHRLDRPLPGAPPRAGTDIDETLGALTDLVHAGKIRYFGSSTFPARRDRRGAVDGRAPRPRAVRLRAAALLAARARDRARRAPGLRALRDGRDLLEPARRRLALGPLPQGRRAPRRARGRPAPLALRHVDPREPAQARRRRRARAAGRGGRHLPDPPRDRLHRSATRRSPRRSSARGRWSSSRASSAPPTSSSRTTLLDRIDEIVPPGTNLNARTTPATGRRR